MITTDNVNTLLSNGGNVVDNDGDKIGKIGQVFLDDESGQPEWVTVKTGLFGTSESFVPLSGASISGDDVHVPFSKDKVKDAPRVDDSEGHLSPDEEAQLYSFYGDSYEGNTQGNAEVVAGDAAYAQPSTTRTTGDADYATGTTGDETYAAQSADTTDTVASAGHDTSGPNTDDAMTRSEERLHVGTENVTTGKARLRKYVVTENVTKTVPVSHEEVRLEREPITDTNVGDALSGGDLTSEEHEVTLNEERVVVNKETVPVERIKLGTETVTEEAQVNETVGKEQIELDDSDVAASAKHRG